MKIKLRKIVMFISFFVSAISFSQTHRFIYQLDKKIKDQTEKISMVLDIDKDFVKFYDYYFIKTDSLSKKTGENIRTNTLSDQLVLRKRGSDENQTFHDNNFDYFAVNSVDKINWKIENEIKKVQNYTLQKATTDFGGRKWTAWFSKEIPFQEGPYKFHGLPGLIFEISDDEKNYSYALVNSVNLPETFSTTNFLETHYGTKPIPVTLKQYHKVKLDYYSDPVAHFSSVLRNGGKITIDGQYLTSQDQLDQKKKMIQQRIKNYNNPVEKDKAVPYPDK